MSAIDDEQQSAQSRYFERRRDRHPRRSHRSRRSASTATPSSWTERVSPWPGPRDRLARGGPATTRTRPIRPRKPPGSPARRLQQADPAQIRSGDRRDRARARRAAVERAGQVDRGRALFAPSEGKTLEDGGVTVEGVAVGRPAAVRRSPSVGRSSKTSAP